MVTEITGIMIKKIAGSWKNVPVTEINPAILNSFPPIRLVLFHTYSLLSVQAVLIPTNQFLFDFSQRTPTWKNKNPHQMGRVTLGFTFTQMFHKINCSWVKSAKIKSKMMNPP